MKTWMWVVLAVLVVGIIAYAIYTMIQKKKKADAAVAANNNSGSSNQTGESDIWDVIHGITGVISTNT